ncbi:MAG: SH3 domain-containing protein [Anaerolineales bacterium]|nr:SH3 domain-containing protein [Anaerolineales bacterium]
MARYQVPPDPRQSNEKRPRRQRGDSREPVPWLWLGLGVIVTIVAIGLALFVASRLLIPPPLNPAALPAPTIIRLTAPPSPTPSATPPFATPTTIPTLTPVPTPDVAVAPDEISIGYYAEVVNTDGFGVRLRGGPSTNNVSITVAEEGAIVLVLAGPEADNERFWWQVRMADDTEGWVAGEFLAPAAAP